MNQAKTTIRVQRGNTLIVALIALVAMSLGGVAIMRAVDSSVLISGNVAFRQATVWGGDRAIEVARQWLISNPTVLDTNQVSSAGYFAFAAATEPSWTSYPWQDPNAAKTITDPQRGTTIAYVIERLCSKQGPTSDPSNICVTGNSTGSVVDADNSKAVGSRAIESSTFYYYRVTAQITGPRNTVSYVQGLIEL